MIKLTDQSGNPVYVKLNAIAAIGVASFSLNGKLATQVWLDGSDHCFAVNESAEYILSIIDPD